MKFSTSDGSRVWRRRSGIIFAGGLTLAAGAVVAGAYLADSGAAPDERDAGSLDVAPTALGLAPSDPPAQICDNASVLDGPSSPPAGAIRVGASENLNAVTQEHPPSTTFWLAPGVHTLGEEPFSQVIAKDGNTYVGAPGAILDGQRLNQYAFGGQATGVTIQHLTVQNFGPRGTNNNEGVVNHDSGSDWVVENNTVWMNAGAGVMVGSGNVIRENCLAQNGQYGFSVFHADNVTDITIAGNEITGNNVDDWETVRLGCGCTGGGKFWKVTGALVQDNWVHDNLGAGLWADTNNVGFAFEGNYISDNEAEGILYETSYNAVIRGNAFVRNGLAKGPTNPGFPTSAVYISESGSDDRVDSDYNETFEISHNVFTDNWAGVILWENADRFAGSPANTSSGSGTLVNPGMVTVDTCNAANIDTEPYIDDCRWKTMNVHVHHNVFSLDPDEIGATCASQSGCGFNGLFANWGTFPDWSPYHEDIVQEAITSEQDNRFYANTYTGPWQFVVYEQGRNVDWASWQGAPYGQDRDSVIKVRTPGER